MDYNATLRNYIAHERQIGRADEVIYQRLLSAGWQSSAIQEALSDSPRSSTETDATSANQTPTPGFFRGRIGRLGFLVAFGYALLCFAALIAIPLLTRESRIGDILVFTLGPLGLLAAFPLSLSLHIRRWHDLDQSGWMTLLAFVPLVNVAVFLLLLGLPGTSGKNRYGSPTRGLTPRVVFGLGSR